MAGYIQNSDGSYSINYDDQRFEDVKNEQAQQEEQINQIYDNIINNSDQHYQNQIDAAKDYANKQSELQQAQTDFTIQQIEQQKEQAQKDYTKEQKASYSDYMKQTKSNAQSMANSGLSNTGYSESSIVSMYNQYQNRVGTAKESLNKAILNYNNSIQQATLANNEKLAEIAFNALQTQNQLNQQAFEYKNSIILAKEEQLQAVNDRYYARYQDVIAQINNEIELQMALDQIDREYEQWLKEFNAKNEQWWANFNAEEKQRQEQIRQWEKEYALSARELALKEKESNSNPYESNNTEQNDSYNKIVKTLSGGNYNTPISKRIAQDLIYNEVSNGNISDAQAEKLFKQFNL